MNEYPSLIGENVYVFLLVLFLTSCVVLIQLVIARQLSAVVETKIEAKQVIIYLILLSIFMGLQFSLSYILFKTQKQHSRSVLLYYLKRVFLNPNHDNYDMPATAFLLNLDNSANSIRKVHLNILPDLLKIVLAMCFVGFLYPQLFPFIIGFVAVTCILLYLFDLMVDETLILESRKIEMYAAKLDQFYTNKLFIKMSSQKQIDKVIECLDNEYMTIHQQIIDKSNEYVLLGGYGSVALYFTFIFLTSYFGNLGKLKIKEKVFLFIVTVDLIHAYRNLMLQFVEFKRMYRKCFQLQNYRLFQESLGKYKSVHKNKKNQILFEFRNVIVQNTTIFNFSYKFRESQNYCVIGKSGSGKSTILNIMSKVQNNFQGEVLYKTRPLASILSVEINNEIFYVSHALNLLSSFTIHENFEFFLGKQDFENDKNYSEIMTNLDLSPSIFEQHVETLSMGQRQRVCLFIALYSSRPILLLDEYISGLPDHFAMKIHKFTIAYTKKNNITCIFVLHNKNLISLCDNIISIDKEIT